MAQPVGCTATILYEIYKMNNIEITPTIAGLMLSAMISDTLLLKSPTTTIKESKRIKELAEIADIDYNVYGLDMLKAGTDLSDYSAEELLEIDAKCVEMKGNKVKVAQVNTADIEDVLKNQKDIELAINKKIEEENLDLFMFAITDIINSNSEAIVLGKRTDIVEKAYNVKLENNRAFLPGVVSRKKQMLPVMQENA
jgi:manganese-dependent inorganic pyrophosphatase